MREHQIRANGTTLRCCVSGPESAQTILFSNSLATDLGMWEQQLGHFSNNYQVVRYDTRGHGGSASTGADYTLSTLVEDVRSLLDALGLNVVHFVGLSLGGMIGQLFAARYPQRLSSLVLCDTAATINRGVWKERVATAREQGLEPLVGPSLERWFTKPFRDANPKLLSCIHQMALGTSVDGYIGCASAMIDMDNTSQLSRIATPTLVIVGKQDPSTPVSDAQLIQEKIAGAQLEIIDEAAHLPNIEQPAKFNKILETFLKQQGATGK